MIKVTKKQLRALGVIMIFLIVAVAFFTVRKQILELTKSQKEIPERRVGLGQYLQQIKLSQKVKDLKVNWEEGNPYIVKGQLTKPVETEEVIKPEKANEVVLTFIKENKALYKVEEPAKELKPLKTISDQIANYVYLEQQVNGIPVQGGELIARVRPNGVLDNITGKYYPEVNIKTQPKITETMATEIVQRDLLSQGLDNKIYSSELMIINPKIMTEIADEAKNGGYRLVWEMQSLLYNYYLDAQTGAILAKTSNVITVDWEVYQSKDCTRFQHQQEPRRLICNQNGLTDNTVDPENVETARCACQNLKYVGDFFQQKFGIDGPLDGRKLVNFIGAGVPGGMFGGGACQSCNAAFFSVINVVSFGNGNERARPLSCGLDVVGHEWTHGFLYNLIGYGNGPGISLSEAMADFFGTMIQAFGQGRPPEWELGDGLPQNGGTGLRNMADPTIYGQPDHMNNYVNCGIACGHYNDGIINKVSYLLTEGGTHYGVNIEGIGAENITQIYYRAITRHLTHTPDFEDFRQAVLDSCEELPQYCGTNGAGAITNAFCSVGLGECTADQHPSPPPSGGVTPRGPTLTRTPTITPGGPTVTGGPSSTPRPTLTPAGPTVTRAPTSTPRPTSTPGERPTYPPEIPSPTPTIWCLDIDHDLEAAGHQGICCAENGCDFSNGGRQFVRYTLEGDNDDINNGCNAYLGPTPVEIRSCCTRCFLP